MTFSLFQNEYFAAIYPRPNYYLEHPDETPEPFWIVRMTDIIDDGHFHAFYLEKNKNNSYSRWLQQTEIKKFKVSSIIVHGLDMLTQTKFLSAKYKKKIDKVVEFEIDVESLTGQLLRV